MELLEEFKVVRLDDGKRLAVYQGMTYLGVAHYTRDGVKVINPDGSELELTEDADITLTLCIEDTLSQDELEQFIEL